MVYAIEQKYVALGKETVRGTAVAPTRYIPVGLDSEMEYKLNLIEDELVRGIFEKFPAKAGTKEGSGRITGMDITSENVGELLLGLLGSVVSAQQGGTSAYKHTFNKLNAVEHPSFTFHFERMLSKKQYSMSVIKSITFTKVVDGKLTCDADILFKTEEVGGFALSPIWTDPKPFMFYQCKVKFDGVDNLTDVKDWTLTIDNGSVAQRVLSTSQDVKNILTFAKLLISGTMNIYFADEVQRNKFLANTSVGLDFELTGDLIEGSYYNKLLLSLPEIHYTAFPFGNLDGLLGASVSFNAYYKVASAKSVQVELTNPIVSY
jgi:hypothetical protein